MIANIEPGSAGFGSVNPELQATIEKAKASVNRSVNLIILIGGAIREMKVVPSGTLYAMVMTRVDLETFNNMIEWLKEQKLIAVNGNMLTWTGEEKA